MTAASQALFAPSSRAEIFGDGSDRDRRAPPAAISGKIDRLLVTAERILLVDYKTNRPAPAELSQVPATHVAQMSLYRELLRPVYPGRAGGGRPASLYRRAATPDTVPRGHGQRACRARESVTKPSLEDPSAPSHMRSAPSFQGESPMTTVKIDNSNFQSDVLEAGEPVVVDFWAEWCGPCKMIAPALEEIATELGGKVKIAKLNIDENPELAARIRRAVDFPR